MTTPFDDPQAELAWMFLQGFYEGEHLDEYFDLLAEDFSYWSLLTGATLSKAEARTEFQRRKERLHIDLELLRCINEGETVVIEANGEAVGADGARYASPLVFIVDTRDGLITSVREYTDTRLSERALD